MMNATAITACQHTPHCRPCLQDEQHALVGAFHDYRRAYMLSLSGRKQRDPDQFPWVSLFDYLQRFFPVPDKEFATGSPWWKLDDVPACALAPIMAQLKTEAGELERRKAS